MTFDIEKIHIITSIYFVFLIKTSTIIVYYLLFFQPPPQPSLKDFEELLKKHSGVFHAARTPRCLQQQWQALKQYTLLPDQSVQPLPR